MGDYQSFLATKTPRVMSSGIEPGPLPAHLFDFQQACVDFNIRQGRAGLYLDTGLGKTRCQLEWAAQCAAASNGRALLLTPLAVAKQIEREAKALGYEARVIRDQSQARDGINICNYDRIDKIEADAFGAVSLDEASVLKSLNGKTTGALTAMFAGHRFRLAATATPAPNDHMELGQQAAFLGIMPANEMLMRWFINDTAEASQQWRLKGHAEQDFWDWMASWSRMAQSPEDLGFDGSRFILPPLNIMRHKAAGSNIKPLDGLFIEDVSATNMFSLKRQTSQERARLAHEIVSRSFSEWRQNNSDGLSESKTSMLVGGPTISTLIPNTESLSKKAGSSKGNTPSDFSTTTCDTSSELGGKTIMQCSPCKTEHVQYAEGQIPEKGRNTSTLTTAIGQGECAGFSATIAIQDSGSFSKTSTASPQRSATSGSLTRPSWVLWCDLNSEQEMLEKEFGNLAFSIHGQMPMEKKEELHEAWLNGERPVLIVKPSMFGHGCNWQHCANMAYVGRTFSYESWYQSVRRCWRFGQTRPVNVHLIVAEGEDQIGRVIDRKSDDHIRMKVAMAQAMNRATGRKAAMLTDYNPDFMGEIPAWLSSAA